MARETAEYVMASIIKNEPADAVEAFHDMIRERARDLVASAYSSVEEETDELEAE